MSTKKAVSSSVFVVVGLLSFTHSVRAQLPVQGDPTRGDDRSAGGEPVRAKPADELVRGSGPSPVRAGDLGVHRESLFSTPAGEVEWVQVVGDDRFKDVPIAVIRREFSRHRTQLVIEGDVIVGREDQIEPAQFNRLRQEAGLLNLADLALRAALGPGQLKVLDELRGLRGLADDALPLQKARARVAPPVVQARRLVLSYQDQPNLQPKRPVDAAGQVLAEARIVVLGQRFRWPLGVIPYYYDKIGMPYGIQQDIEAAVHHWNRSTERVLLRPTKQSDPYWVEFVFSTSCASNVGKVVQRGPQKVFLNGFCTFDQVVHEIGHAVGLFHQHTRNDRDKFLSIQIQNAIDGTAFQLPLRGQAEDVGPFDFASVMLYASDAFTKNGLPTMVVKQAIRAQVGDNWGINHRQNAGLQGLSKGDVAGVAFMYPDPANRDPNLDLRQFVRVSAPTAPSGESSVRPGGQPETPAVPGGVPEKPQANPGSN